MGLVLLLNNSPNVVGDQSLFFTLNVCPALDTVVEVPSMLEPFDGRSCVGSLKVDRVR
jgi:hypothetical protein